MTTAPKPQRIPFDTMPSDMTCFTVMPLGNPKAVTFGCRRKVGHPDAPEPKPDVKDWANVGAFIVKGIDHEEHTGDTAGVLFIVRMMLDWANNQDWLLEEPEMKAGFDWCLEQLKKDRSRMVDYLMKDRVMMDRLMFLLFHFITKVDEEFWEWFATDNANLNQRVQQIGREFKQGITNVQEEFKSHETHHLGFEISTHHIGLHTWGNRGAEPTTDHDPVGDPQAMD